MSLLGLNLQSTRLRLMLLFTALAAGIGYYLASGLIAHVGELREGSQLAATSDVSVAASGLVHELQKERGLSAGFIGSRGASFGDALIKQRKDTDDRRSKLTGLLSGIPASTLPAALASGLDAADALLKEIEARRQEISALTLAGPQSFNFYTTIIDAYLNSIAQVSPNILSGAMARQFSAYVMFLNAKEQAGRERATVNAAFAADIPLAVPAFRRLQTSVTSQEIYLSEFRNLTDATGRKAIDLVLADAPAQEAARMRSIAFEQAFLGNFETEPATWFATITAKIDAMKGLEDQLAGSIAKSAESVQAEATTALAIALVCTVLVFGITALFLWLLSGTLRAVSDSTASARRIALGDLAGAPVVTRKDEIGQLEAAISQIQVNLHLMIDDTQTLAQAAVEGRLATRADASKHQGDYQKVVTGVNNTLDAVIGPLNVAARYVDESPRASFHRPSPIPTTATSTKSRTT